MITVMWAVWHSRNRYTHGEQVYQPSQSMIIIEEIVRALEFPVSVKNQPVCPPRWMPPDEDWVKINTDGATHSSRVRGGTGFVARDHHGFFLRAGGSRYEGIIDPLTLELLACRDGLSMACDMGLHRVEVQTDCQEIIRLWESPQKSSCYHLLKEIEVLSTFFQGFKLRFANRRCNTVAHRVARHSLARSS